MVLKDKCAVQEQILEAEDDADFQEMLAEILAEEQRQKAEMGIISEEKESTKKQKKKKKKSSSKKTEL